MLSGAPFLVAGTLRMGFFVPNRRFHVWPKTFHPHSAPSLLPSGGTRCWRSLLMHICGWM